MNDDALATFVGQWDLQVDLPGAEDARGHVEFDLMGPLLVQRASVPDPAPNSNCVIVPQSDGTYVQHYFDSRGTARLYAMTFDGHSWTLQRSAPDFTPLDFHQRYLGTVSDDGNEIVGEWQSSNDGETWNRDFALTYRRSEI